MISASTVASVRGGLHLAEFLPPVGACVIYLQLYARRARTLRRQARPVPGWRAMCFVGGALLMAVVQLPPFDSLADEVLIAHVVQHILIGDIASLLIVLGLTGAVLQPLLQTRLSRSLRVLAHPLVALALWAVNLYTWHLPFLYQLAIRVDIVHALEHACLLWFGSLLWLSLLGPLPKPRWFEGWGSLGYVVSVRFIGAALANALIWAQTVFYPVYRSTDAARRLSATADQNLAGGVMMIEQIFLTTALLAWLFMRFASRDEQRQALLDLAEERGAPISDERAARAATAGSAAAARLQARVLARERTSRRPE
jgi:cytochrome c oxidase assembly factor CtaG